VMLNKWIYIGKAWIVYSLKQEGPLWTNWEENLIYTSVVEVLDYTFLRPRISMFKLIMKKR
jgi:hypothetical protein